MDGSITELIVEEPGNSVDPAAENEGYREKAATSVEELVAKAIAPVKREYLLPPPITTSIKDVPSDAVSDTKASPQPPPLFKEKKSKRQIKRECHQDQKSVLHLCPEVAKSGNVNSCPYSDKCCFSHDVEAFKAEKPADLEGNCPFLEEEGPCPYGLACRFSGTHKDDIHTGTVGVKKRESETNGLKKDVQKLLWKNKMKFPKADGKLKILGLLQGKANSKKKNLADNEDGNQTVADAPHTIDENGCSEVVNDLVIKFECSPEVLEENDNTDNTSAPDKLRPLKKAKLSMDESHSCEVNNGSSVQEKELEENCEQVTKTDHILTETDGSLKLHPREKRLIDFSDKLYLAPLTTVGNLPFRRLCKVLGADVTW